MIEFSVSKKCAPKCDVHVLSHVHREVESNETVADGSISLIVLNCTYTMGYQMVLIMMIIFCGFVIKIYILPNCHRCIQMWIDPQCTAFCWRLVLSELYDIILFSLISQKMLAYLNFIILFVLGNFFRYGMDLNLLRWNNDPKNIKYFGFWMLTMIILQSKRTL